MCGCFMSGNALLVTFTFNLCRHTQTDLNSPHLPFHIPQLAKGGKLHNQTADVHGFP